MSLIQISKLEPCANLGAVVGIDFGTTNSLVAYIKNDKVHIVPIDENTTMLPSVVAYTTEGVIVGNEALNYSNAVISIKRLMCGEKIKFLSKFPNVQVEEAESGINLKIHDKNISNIEVASEIFKKLKSIAENDIKESISTAVITVPAYFSNKAKEAIKIAAKLAGINPIRLLAEPTSAALAYQIKDEGIYLVYDFGGGTFDVSIIYFDKGVFKVLAVGGDDMLGGDDCDYALAQKMIDDLSLKIYVPNDLRQLKNYAKIIKEKLSTTDEVDLMFHYNNKNYNYKISINEFDACIDDIVKKTISITIDAIKLANVGIDQIKNILLIGGSTKMNSIFQKLTKVFPKEKIICSKNPETAVVEGAALQAHALNFGSKTLIIDVTPLSLGIETVGGLMERIIERSTSIPVSKQQIFTTHFDNQTAILINIFQGERELVKDNKHLAQLELRGIPSMPAGVPKIKVDFTIDENGLLKISAHEVISNIVQETIINPGYELTEDKIKEMINESFVNAHDDISQREVLNAKIALERTISLIENLIKEDRELLDNKEYEVIIAALNEAKSYIDSNIDDIKTIYVHKKNIEVSSEKFLEKRFNKKLKEISLTK